MEKNFFISFLLILISVCKIHAQSVYFSFKDGTQAAYNFIDISNNKFSDDVMILNKTDGSSISWNVSTISNFSYNKNSVSVNEVENTAELSIYPNPSKGKVIISYTNPRADEINTFVYDQQGKVVKQWELGKKEAGKNELVWITEGLSKGSYIIRFITEKGSFSKTIIIE